MNGFCPLQAVGSRVLHLAIGSELGSVNGPSITNALHFPGPSRIGWQVFNDNAVKSSRFRIIGFMRVRLVCFRFWVMRRATREDKALLIMIIGFGQDPFLCSLLSVFAGKGLERLSLFPPAHASCDGKFLLDHPVHSLDHSGSIKLTDKGLQNGGHLPGGQAGRRRRALSL